MNPDFYVKKLRSFGLPNATSVTCRGALARELLLTPAEQVALRRKMVVIVGLGPIGGRAAAELARFGLGTIALADSSKYSPDSLLSDPSASIGSLGQSRREVVCQNLLGLNPYVRLLDTSLESETWREWLSKADLVLDALPFSSLTERALIYDAACDFHCPLVTTVCSGTRASCLYLPANAAQSFASFLSAGTIKDERTLEALFAARLFPTNPNTIFRFSEELAAAYLPPIAFVADVASGLAVAEILSVLRDNVQTSHVSRKRHLDIYRGLISEQRDFQKRIPAVSKLNDVLLKKRVKRALRRIAPDRLVLASLPSGAVSKPNPPREILEFIHGVGCDTHAFFSQQVWDCSWDGRQLLLRWATAALTGGPGRELQCVIIGALLERLRIAASLFSLDMQAVYSAELPTGEDIARISFKPREIESDPLTPALLCSGSYRHPRRVFSIDKSLQSELSTCSLEHGAARLRWFTSRAERESARAVLEAARDATTILRSNAGEYARPSGRAKEKHCLGEASNLSQTDHQDPFLKGGVKQDNNGPLSANASPQPSRFETYKRFFKQYVGARSMNRFAVLSSSSLEPQQLLKAGIAYQRTSLFARAAGLSTKVIDEFSYMADYRYFAITNSSSSATEPEVAEFEAAWKRLFTEDTQQEYPLLCLQLSEEDSTVDTSSGESRSSLRWLKTQ